MSYVIAFESDDDRPILVETPGEPPPGPELAARGGVLVERAEVSFSEAIERLRPVASTVVSKLSDMAQQPDDITVEMGIKLSAKAGAIIASTDAEANLKIVMTWRRSRSGTAD